MWLLQGGIFCARRRRRYPWRCKARVLIPNELRTFSFQFVITTRRSRKDEHLEVVEIIFLYFEDIILYILFISFILFEDSQNGQNLEKSCSIRDPCGLRCREQTVPSPARCMQKCILPTRQRRSTLDKYLGRPTNFEPNFGNGVLIKPPHHGWCCPFCRLLSLVPTRVAGWP